MLLRAAQMRVVEIRDIEQQFAEIHTVPVKLQSKNQIVAQR
jgi:hypothetical protein